MPEGKTWEEVSASYEARVEQMRSQARNLYRQMVDHIRGEIARTGVAVEIVPPGTVLPKLPGTAPVAIRMDVTPTTANFARQMHVGDLPGERRRSWPIKLQETRMMPATVKNGLTRFVEQLAELQGMPVDRPQGSLNL